MNGLLLLFYAMSEEQLSALLAKLKQDVALKERLKGAADLDAAVAMAQEAGFDVSKADWLSYGRMELSDWELEGVSGGSIYTCIFGNCGGDTGCIGSTMCPR